MRWRWLGVVGLVVVIVVAGVVVGFGAGLFHPTGGRSLPEFPSLAEHPDRSLHGTVAYANDTGCVRIVAASGSPSKDVYCIPRKDLEVKPKQGMKPAGPQLVWLPDDRLEVTMFFWTPPSGGAPPLYRAGWQKIIDVHTGRAVDVPAQQVPSTPRSSPGPTVSPNGEQVRYTSDPSTGRVKVTLTDAKGTRTLLSARGPGEYTYGFGPVFWAPNWQWIAASDDGRILIITPATPSQTRVLVTGSGGGAGGGTAGPAYAVTSSDLFSATT